MTTGQTSSADDGLCDTVESPGKSLYMNNDWRLVVKLVFIVIFEISGGQPKWQGGILWGPWIWLINGYDILLWTKVMDG